MLKLPLLFFSYFLSVFLIKSEKIFFVSQNSTCDELCDGSSSDKAFNSIFSSFQHIKLEYNQHENFDYIIVILDLIHVLNENAVNLYGSYNNDLGIFTFFENCSNLNITITSFEKSKIFIRTHNFTVFLGEYLTISNVEFYGNDMIFLENTLGNCDQNNSLCCDERSIFEKSNNSCYFSQKILDGSQTSSFFLTEKYGKEITICLINVNFNMFVGIYGKKIKYTSFIKSELFGNVILKVQNSSFTDCFFENSFLDFGQIDSQSYFFDNLKINSYNSLDLSFKNSKENNYFLIIERSIYFELRNAEFNNSMNVLSFKNNDQILIENLTIFNLETQIKNNSCAIYFIENNRIIINLMKIKNFDLEISDNSTILSIIFVDKSNIINASYFEFNNISHLQGTYYFIFLNGQNNSLSFYNLTGKNLSINGCILYSNDNLNSINLQQIDFRDVSVRFCEIIQNNNISLSYGYFERISPKFSQAFFYFHKNNIISFAVCKFNNLFQIVDNFNIFQFEDFNLFYLQTSVFQNMNFSNSRLFSFSFQNKIFIEFVNNINVSLANSDSYGIISIKNSSNIFNISNSFFENCVTGLEGSIFHIKGQGNTMEISNSKFLNDKAKINGAVGSFINNNDITLTNNVFIDINGYSPNYFYCFSIDKIKIISSFIYRGNSNYFLVGNTINVFYFSNNTLLKMQDGNDIVLNTIQKVIINNSTFKGYSLEGYQYSPLLSLADTQNLLINSCSFLDLNILTSTLGVFDVAKILIIANSLFKNMLSWSFDYGYIVKSTYYNANALIKNCSFFNITSTNMSQIFYFQTNNVVKIQYCIFSGINSINSYSIEPNFYFGSAIISSLYNSYVEVSQNQFENFIYNNSIWGPMIFSSTYFVVVQKNIFQIENVVPGSIVYMKSQNYVCFKDNLIMVENLFSIFQNYNYSLFYLSTSNKFFCKGTTYIFKNFVQQIRENQGFIIFIDSQNELLIEDMNFENNYNQKIGKTNLIYSKSQNEIKIISCYFDNKFISSFIFSYSQNNIFIANSFFYNFLNGIVTSENKDQILFQNSTISNCSNNFNSIFTLKLANQILISNSIIKNCQVSYSPEIDAYDSNFIFIQDSAFQNYETNSKGGVLFGSINNEIYLNNLTIIGIIAFSGSIAHLENNNEILINGSNFSNIRSLTFGGSFFLLSNNTFFVAETNIVESSSLEYAGFLISYTNNLILSMFTSFESIYSVANSGGCFYLIFKSKLYITQNIFRNTSSEEESGGFLKADNLNLISIKNCMFFKTSSLKGGLIFLESSNSLILTNCFGNNSLALLYGGVINGNYMNTIVLSNFSFDSSVSMLDGGLFYMTSQNYLEISNILLFNSMSLNGISGGFYLDSNNKIAFYNITIIDFYSFDKGSLMYFRNNNSLLGKNFSAYYIGSYLANDYISNSGFQFDLQNSLKIKYGFFGGDLNCGIMFSFNNSIVFLEYFQINHSKKSNITLFFVEKTELNMFRVKIYSDYIMLFRSKNSSLILSSLMHIPSFQKRFDQTYIFLENSKIIMKKIKINLPQQEISLFLVRVIYSYQSKIVIDNARITGIVNKNPGIKLFEIINSEVVVKNSIIASNLQLSKDFSSNFHLIYTENAFGNITMSSIFKKCIFLNNQAFKYSSNLNIINFLNDSDHTSTIIQQNIFYFNKGNLGGAIHISNISNTTIIRNYFKKNYATFSKNNQKAKGGAIYAAFTYKSEIKFLILFNSFIKNLALIGGVFYICDPFNQIKAFANIFFKNNAFLYGDIFASVINRLIMLESDEGNYVSLIQKRNPIINVISGYNYSTTLLKIGAFDKFNNFLWQTDENFLENIKIIQQNALSNLNSFSFSQLNGFIGLNGVIRRNDLPITGRFNYSLEYNSFATSSSLNFIINFQNCEFGSRLNENFKCELCPIGTFSFETDFTNTSPACKSCNLMNFACYGGDLIVPKPGFWRLNGLSTNFIECFVQSHCLGDNQTLNSSNYEVLFKQNLDLKSGLCEQGYTGAICSVCSKGYGKIDRYNCVKCNDMSYSIVLILGTLARAGFVVASVYYATRKCNAISRNSEKSINKVFKSNLLKMMTNHMQVLMIISSFPFQWPSSVSLFFSYFFSISPNVAEGFSFECLIKNKGYDLNDVYLKLEIIAIYPLILLLLSLVVLKAIKKIKEIYKNCKKRFSKNKEIKLNNPRFRSILNKKQKINISFCMQIICVFAIILFNCYQDIMKYVLQMFSCIEIGDPYIAKVSEKRLLIDLSINCDSQSHQTIILALVLPLIIFIGVLFPTSLCFILARSYKKGNLNKPENLYKFGYFYYSYKRPYFYWDFLILLRKMTILFIYCIFFTGKQLDDIYPIFIILIILIINLIFQIEIKPFDIINFNLLNILEKYSLASLSMTIYLSLFLFTYLSTSSNHKNEIFYSTISIMMISNLIFFLKWLRISYKHLIKPEVQTYIKKTSIIINALRNKLSKNPSVCAIPSSSSLETIESERKNLVFEKIRKASFELMQRKKQKQEDNKESPKNLFSFRKNHENLQISTNISDKIIIEEEEEESPMKIKKIKRESVGRNELFSLVSADGNVNDDVDEYCDKNPKKRKTQELNPFFDYQLKGERNYSAENIDKIPISLDDYIRNFGKNPSLFELSIPKNDFLYCCLDRDYKNIIENEDFSVVMEDSLKMQNTLRIKMYFKAKHDQFNNFQINFIENKDIIYKYEISYLSPDNSPNKLKRNASSTNKIKDFFSPKFKILLTVYIKFLRLEYLEVFESKIRFQFATDSKTINFNICLALPITLNKFIEFSELTWQDCNQSFNLFTHETKIKINFDIVSNIDVFKKFLPFCEIDQEENQIKFSGNFFFWEENNGKKEFFYEFIFNTNENEMVLRIMAIQDEEIFLKKLTHSFGLLLSEIII